MVFTIYGHGSHLGHVTRILLKKIISMYPKAYIQNLVKNGPVVSEKSKFEFSYVNDLDLKYLHKLNKLSASTNFQDTGEISTVFTFSYRKA